MGTPYQQTQSVRSVNIAGRKLAAPTSPTWQQSLQGFGTDLFGAGGWSAGLGVLQGAAGIATSILDMKAAEKAAKQAARMAAGIIEEGVGQANIALREGQVFAAAELIKFGGVDVTTGSPADNYRQNIYRAGLNAASVAKAYNRRALEIVSYGQQSSSRFAGRAVQGAVSNVFNTVKNVPDETWAELGFE